MGVQTVIQIFLSFCIYSFLGWVCETIYCSIERREFVNRGFLSGPVCPVYGFGALAVLWLLSPMSRWPVLLFLAAMVVTSILEYFTGFLLETFFHTKWWDYSNFRFNIHGRVCLLNSILFGLMGTVLVLFLNPLVQRGLKRIPPDVALIASILLFLVLIWDTVHTVQEILSLDKTARELSALRKELREKAQAYRETLIENIQDHVGSFSHIEDVGQLREKLREKIESMPHYEGNEQLRAILREQMEKMSIPDRSIKWKQRMPHESLEEIAAHFEQVSKRLTGLKRDVHKEGQRLLRAFPKMRSMRHEDSFEWLRASLLMHKEKKEKENQDGTKK